LERRKINCQLFILFAATGPRISVAQIAPFGLYITLDENPDCILCFTLAYQGTAQTIEVLVRADRFSPRCATDAAPLRPGREHLRKYANPVCEAKMGILLDASGPHHLYPLRAAGTTPFLSGHLAKTNNVVHEETLSTYTGRYAEA
jgi:hypothetical protein